MHRGRGFTEADDSENRVALVGALAVTRALRGLLFDTSPFDPATFGAVVLLLAAVALLACWLPARRASRVSPLEALRAD